MENSNMESLQDAIYSNAVEKSGKTAAAWVTEEGVKCGTAPLYQLDKIGGSAHNPHFSCILKMRAIDYHTDKLQDYEVVSQASSKKNAQQIAARKLLMKINFISKLKKIIPELNLQENSSNPSTSSQSVQFIINNPTPPTVMDDSGCDPLSVNKLVVFCGEKNLPEPEYKELDAVGPPNARIFTYKCSVGELEEIVNGKTKKGAKKLGAHLLLEKLKSSTVTVLAAKNPNLTTPAEPIKISLSEYENLSSVPKLDFSYSQVCRNAGTNDCENNFIHINHKFQLWNDDLVQELNKRFRNQPEESMTILNELSSYKDFKIVYSSVDSLANGTCEENNLYDADDNDDEKMQEFDYGGYTDKGNFQLNCFLSLETYPLIMVYGEGHNELECRTDSAKRALEHLFGMIMTENIPTENIQSD